MIITLTGNNAFALKQRTDELVKTFIAKYGALALERIDAQESEIEAILESVQSQPFLAERKMVVIRDLSTNKTAAEQVEQIISSTNESTDLIIYEPLTDKRTAFYKILKTKTNFEEYNKLDERELPKWLIGEAKRHGGELGFAEAKYLVDRVGTDQYLLSNELTKLVTYDSKVTQESIDLLTEPTPQSKIFELLDAAFAGKKARALKLYGQQRAQKVEPQAILAMIAWQLQLIALVKKAGNRSPAEIAKDSGANEFPIRKALSLATKISDEQLKTMVSEALEIDWRSKTTALDLNEALKTYITTL